MLSYTVKRGFHRDGVYYTRENADQIKELPRKDRDELIEAGTIEEHNDRATPDAEPASPATASKKGK